MEKRCFWLGMHYIRASGIIYCVHHWQKPNISLMGNNCCRVGSDAFICTEERSYVHPVIRVTQQTLAMLAQQSNLHRCGVLRCGSSWSHAVSLMTFHGVIANTYRGLWSITVS